MINSYSQKHSFHLVDPSPWPILTAFSVLPLPISFVLYFNGYPVGSLFENGLESLILVSSLWWRDVIREGAWEGQHTAKVVQGFRYGMLLFILSEVMFFFAFFWSFFYFSFNPSIAIGGVWPPMFLQTLNPFEIPFLNTVVLLTSGATITWCHHAIVRGNSDEAAATLSLTIFFASYFTFLQMYEYTSAPFTISDGVYGSIFYVMTGFHGLHVFIGSTFLTVCLWRLYEATFTRTQHFGFEAAAWYWHFVDVVWLFLYVAVYLWGSF